jgi:general secretion pathway protein D
MTSSIPYRLRHIAASSVLTGLLAGNAALWMSPASAQTVAKAFKPGEPVTLNFANAEIEAVARAMSAITGRTVVVDPSVKGTINLSTETPVTPTVAYNQFLATIRLQGYTVVQSAGLDKVVP